MVVHKSFSRKGICVVTAADEREVEGLVFVFVNGGFQQLEKAFECNMNLNSA